MAAQRPKDEVYRVRRIGYYDRVCSVVMQNENGPCPLLALCNVLLLRGKITIHEDSRHISLQSLLQIVGDYLVSTPPTMRSDLVENYQHNVEDALKLLPTLDRGLDINLRFSSPTDFEYTESLVVFDVCQVPLYHAWVCDPQDTRTWECLKGLSYNQVVEGQVLGMQHASGGTCCGDPPSAEHTAAIERGTVLGQWLQDTSSQMTVAGLEQLHATVKERELAVLFRNNHFGVVTKHGDMLYLLLTDLGFADHSVVWERLSEVEGDAALCMDDFRTYVPPKEDTPPPVVPAATAVADPAAAAAAAAAPCSQLDSCTEGARGYRR
eukprot:m51a1_g5588 hypothetical protein (323) ;mRNA; f:643157-644489